MKTQGEIEAAVCKGISRFEQDYMGRGPKDIQAYLINDLLVVRLKGVLTVAEQQLVASLPAEMGRDLLKQVRIHLIETERPIMEAMIKDVTGVEVVSLHHDISTVTVKRLCCLRWHRRRSIARRGSRTCKSPPAFRFFPALSLAMDPTVARGSCNSRHPRRTPGTTRRSKLLA